MPNYNDAQAVADLLSQFDFNIISEGPGDFSTQHRKTPMDSTSTARCSSAVSPMRS